MKKSKQPKTHFVPRAVFEAAFVGVVPICVAAAACGDNGDNSVSVAGIGFGPGDDQVGSDVAEAAFSRDAPFFGVANIGFDAGDANNAPDDQVGGDVADAAFSRDAPFISVANIGFDGGVADNAFRVPDASDAGDAHERDSSFGVADAGFRPPDGSAG
jgi:hypothetical protein